MTQILTKILSLLPKNCYKLTDKINFIWFSFKTLNLRIIVFFIIILYSRGKFRVKICWRANYPTFRDGD